jgi:hypothetical protein
VNKADFEAASRRYTPRPCARTARTTKYGSPYTLICQASKGHGGNCRDVDNGIWFEPDA